jgi:hypothetical protein
MSLFEQAFNFGLAFGECRIVGIDGDGERGIGPCVFMAAIDPCFVWKCGQTGEGSKHVLGGSLEQPATAEREQGVTGKQQLLVGNVEADMAQGMARC